METQPMEGTMRMVTDWALIVAFLMAICLPAADTLLRFDPSPEVAERASPPSPPRLGRYISVREVVGFCRSMKEYLRADFGLRRAMLRGCNLAELRLFRRFS